MGDVGHLSRYITSHPGQLSLAIPVQIKHSTLSTEYQPKGGDALWLGSESRHGLCVERPRNTYLQSSLLGYSRDHISEAD